MAVEPARNPGGGRNLQLDILRGIAILLVIGWHLELPRPDGMNPHIVGPSTPNFTRSI